MGDANSTSLFTAPPDSQAPLVVDDPRTHPPDFFGQTDFRPAKVVFDRFNFVYLFC